MKNSTKLINMLVVMILATALFTATPVQSQTIPQKPCLEHFTSSTCAPCAAFAPVFRKALSGYTDYTIIRYQMYWPGSGDPYYFAESKKRRDYYTITGVPGLTLNGVKEVPYAQNFSTKQMDSLLTQVTGVSIGITSSINADKIVTATITITPEIAYPAGLVTQIVVMEANITQNASTNGERAFDHVTMAFMPDATGTVLPALVPGQPVTLTYTTDMKTTHMETANDLIVAAFIQDNATKHIVQSNNAPVSHPFTDYKVTLNIIDNDYNTVPGGLVFIPYYGEKSFGADGLATFTGIFAGDITYTVTAPNYDGTQEEVTVTNSDITKDVMIEKPDLFFFEDFGGNAIPNGWLSSTTGSFYLTGTTTGTIVFYKQEDGDDENYLILPPVGLTQTGIFSYKAGIQYGTPELKVGIATLEAAPGTEGTSGMKITGFAELNSRTITNADGFTIVGFPLPETIGNQRLAFKYVGTTGSFCELDQVAILEDNPGVKVQFIVTDQNDAPLKSTEVSLSGKTVVNNAYGYATFRDTDLGTYVYSVKYKGEEIASGTLAVNDALVKEIKYSTSGVVDIPAESKISVYPNPVKDHFTVNGSQGGTVSITTLNGQELMRKRFVDGERISAEGLAKGIYLVKIQSENQVVYQKIMVTK